ncbi:MAG: hypothetical protein PHE41_06190 [Eubacteriales bacterium]|nr:hypothetical protein [Eubacteriales bacterium]
MNKKVGIEDDWLLVETKDLMRNLPNYFDFTGDIDNSSYLNWRFDSFINLENQFYNIGKAYFETSLALIDLCLSDNRDKKADIWIFPIMFNVVHGIEVYLKGFNSQLKILNKLENEEHEKTKIEGKHDIKQLCQVAIGQIKAGNRNDILDEFLFLQKFIDILYDNTNDMTFARYPITAKGARHFYVEQKDNITIDLNIFKVWVKRVYHILDSFTGFVDYQIDEISNWLYEMQLEYGNY